MRVVFYVRVSTNEQTVAPQLDALEAYATARGLDVVDVYTDEGISGSKDRRPALDEMMSKAKRRSFDAIAIVKLDRLARSTRHLTQLAAELEAWGVDLIVLDQGVDTSTPSGKLLFAILGRVRARPHSGTHSSGHEGSPETREAHRPTKGLSGSGQAAPGSTTGREHLCTVPRARSLPACGAAGVDRDGAVGKALRPGVRNHAESGAPEQRLRAGSNRTLSHRLGGGS